jgi:cysteinyl-tRNA synthetase
LLAKQASIHAALCDSFNTPKVMQDLRDLVAASNNYLNDKMREKGVINVYLILKIAKYVTRMMRIFGVAQEDSSLGLGSSSNTAAGNAEDIAMPYLKVLADYRDGIRNLAQQKAGE